MSKGSGEWTEESSEVSLPTNAHCHHFIYFQPPWWKSAAVSVFSRHSTDGLVFYILRLTYSLYLTALAMGQIVVGDVYGDSPEVCLLGIEAFEKPNLHSLAPLS